MLRPAVLLVIAAAIAGAIAGDVRAQEQRPPVLAPPVSQFVLCSLRFGSLVAKGFAGEPAGDSRVMAVALTKALYQRESDLVTARVEDELGPLAWSVFVPGEPNAAQKRFDEMHAEACVRQSLVRGGESADAEERARSQELIRQYDERPVLPERFFLDGAVGAERADAAIAALRLELPPSELIVAGGLITGRVVIDEERSGDGVVGPVDALADGLLAELAGQTARVGREGLFVLRAPDLAGTYTVEVRHLERPLLVPVEGRFTVARRDVAADGARASEGPTVADLPTRPEIACSGLDGFLDATLAGEEGAVAPAECAIAVPRVVLPDQRLVVIGRLGEGSGRSTRAFFGPSEAPLLARTPIAAVFDAHTVPAGFHALALYDGGRLLAVSPVHRVRLNASSDRPDLGRDEVATFNVRVEGLPRSWPGDQSALTDRPDTRAIAFLDYVNRSPQIGKFRDRPDRFAVAIARTDLVPEPAALRSEDQRTLLDRIEKPMTRRSRARNADAGADAAGDASAGAESGATDPAAAVADTPANAAGKTGSFENVQRYRGMGDGDYHVQVSVRLPEEAAKLVPAITVIEADPSAAPEAPQPPRVPVNTVGEPIAATGIDDRGVFATIDGAKLYFSTATQPQRSSVEPPALRLFDSSCSGTCQCSIQSWEHSREVAAQVTSLDGTRPDWRAVTATADACGCDQAKAACYGLLSLECKTRCKRFFEGPRTDFVSGFAIDATVNACSDRGACDR